MKNHSDQKPLAGFHLARQKRIPELVALAFALLAVVGCGVATQAEIPLSSVAKEIETRGYRVQKSLALPPTDWEISRFRMGKRVVVEFKAKQPMPNETDTYYCRFILFEETYDSHNDARGRLDHLHERSPDGLADEQYTHGLREGFVVDRTVYILQTDAVKFFPEVQGLTKLLAASRTGQS